jgi:integrase
MSRVIALSGNRLGRPALPPRDRRCRCCASSRVSLLAASAALDDRIEKKQTRRLRQACLRLRGQGRTHAQIAVELGVPESTAYYHASKFGKVAPTVRVRMYEALIWVLFIAGLRISEALALRCEDIHMLHRNIYVQDSKTESGRRVVHIHPPAFPVLKAYIQARGDTWRDGEYAFCTSKGTPLSRHNVARRTMPRLVRAANDLRHRKGCPPITARVTAHGMRHAYVALIAHSSAPQIYAQKQAGHQRASTTEEIYNYVFREDTRERVGREMVKVLTRAERKLDANEKRLDGNGRPRVVAAAVAPERAPRGMHDDARWACRLRADRHDDPRAALAAGRQADRGGGEARRRGDERASNDVREHEPARRQRRVGASSPAATKQETAPGRRTTGTLCQSSTSGWNSSACATCADARRTRGSGVRCSRCWPSACSSPQPARSVSRRRRSRSTAPARGCSSRPPASCAVG